jgi:caffeoyl-CoA O-methyltransferase
MKLISSELIEHLNKLVPERNEILRDMEARAARDGFPIIGPASGQACYLVARMIKAKKIYELGSGFGYSTAWFARAVKENGGGEVHHVVWDEALSREARGNLDQLGYSGIVQYTVGEAVASLEKSQEEYDLIFCDIDKDAYPEAIRVAYEKLTKGGILIVDNMLWGGDIFDTSDQSAFTLGICEATDMLAKDDKWIHTLIPIRDGLMLAMKD